jgi:hypothetical protein
MVTREEYIEIYKEIYERVDAVRRRATKISTKGNFFEPISLRMSAEKYLKQIESVRNVYAVSPVYKNKDFTDYVAKLRADASNFEALATKYEAIAKAME